MKAFLKIPLLAVMLVILSAVSVISPCAQTGKIISLSSVSTRKGRLCKAELSAEGIENICAFIAELEYDPDILSFRGIKSDVTSSDCSAFSKEEGKVRFVFVCEEGVDATSKTTLLSLEFKAETEGNSPLDLRLIEAVDYNGNYIEGITSRGAEVSSRRMAFSAITNKLRGQKPDASLEEVSIAERNTAEVSTEPIEDSESRHSLKSGGINSLVLIYISAAGLILIFTTAFISYRAGMKKQRIRDFSANRLLSKDILSERKKESEEEK